MDTPRLDTEHEEDTEENEREAFELHGDVLGNVPVANSPPLPVSRKGYLYGGVVKMIPRSLSTFWKHQISATVPHVECRNHLGMYDSTTYILVLYWACPLTLAGNVL